MFGFIDRFGGGIPYLRTEDDGALAVAVVDMVKRTLQPLVFAPVFGIEQVRDYGSAASAYEISS